MAGNEEKSNQQRATLGLAGPAVWSRESKKISDLQGVDILAGNEGVDISPVAVKSAALFSQEQTEKNAFKPAQVAEGFELSSAKTKIQQGMPSFAPQNGDKNIAGVEGVNFQNYEDLIDKELQGSQTESTTREFPFSVKRAGSALVSETGPEKSENAIRVPKPSQPSNYQTILEAKDPTGVISAVVNMLKEKNLYSPTAEGPFFQKLSENQDVATRGVFTVQRELGKFINKPDEVPDSASGQRVTLDALKRITSAFLVLATGDKNGAYGLLSNGGASSTLENPLVQIGLQGVNVSQLELKSLAGQALTAANVSASSNEQIPAEIAKILQAATGNDTIMPRQKDVANTGDVPSPTNRGSNSVPYNSVSYGQINNFLEPFGNGVLFDSTGMLFIAASSIVSLLSVSLVSQQLVQIFQNTLGLQESDGYSARDPTQPWLLEFGKSHVTKDNNNYIDSVAERGKNYALQDLMKIPQIDASLISAILAGIPSMVGFPAVKNVSDLLTNLQAGQGLIDFAVNLVSSPGYYVNLIRTILLSGREVSSSFDQIGTGNASQGFEKFFSSLEKLTSSSIYKFLMVAASVGDAVIKSIDGAPTVQPDQRMTTAIFAAQGGFNDGAIRNQISRWDNSGYKNPLSLSSFVISGISDTRTSNMQIDTYRTQFTTDSVRLMEARLEAEYMPFYFHDLRNDEILSMPAFVTSFDDNFSVNLNPMNSYGRQDPIRIYQGTERSINLVFKIVAFSVADHKRMWYIINRLVAMVYPMYSQGVKRKLGLAQQTANSLGEAGSLQSAIEFIQPFSQIQTASPLIRIRLGDVYKSNYSMSALKNLFGYNENNPSATSRVKFEADRNTNTEALYNEIRGDYIKSTQKTISSALESVRRKTHEIQNAINSVFGNDDEPKEFLALKAAIEAQHVRFKPKQSLLILEGDIGKYKKQSDRKNFFAEIKKISKNNISDLSKQLGVPISNVSKNSITQAVIKKDVILIWTGDKTALLVNAKGDTKSVNLALGWFGNDNKKLLNYINFVNMEPNIEWPNRKNSKYKGKLLDAVDEDFNKALKKADDSEEAFNQNEKANIQNKLERGFFNRQNNAIVRSFESSKGKGLAGFITNLAFDYSESTWATDRKGAKAPMSVTVTMGFAPIFDLPIGLDADGRMRALSHPALGDGNEGFGSVYEDDPTYDAMENFFSNIDYLDTPDKLKSEIKE